MLERCTEETRAAVNSIMDTMAGADGGVSFYRLCVLVEDMDVQAQAGNPAAQQVIEVVNRFNRLIQAAPKYTR